LKKTRGVLFDLDGVLVLTEPLKAAAHVATVKELGGDAPPSLYPELMGQSHDAVRRAFLAAAGLTAEPMTYTQTFGKIYHHLIQTQLELAPGAIELLKELAGTGYKLAVVTSSSSQTLANILRQADLAAFFDAQVSADDVAQKKPAPDAYVLALRLLNLPPTCAVVIEDSDTGIQAASAAGLRALAIRHSLNARHDLTQAYAVFDSLQDSNLVHTIDALLSPGNRGLPISQEAH
jgi:HAD superfamily hydrolase (TIGR01509 family)